MYQPSEREPGQPNPDLESIWHEQLLAANFDGDWLEQSCLLLEQTLGDASSTAAVALSTMIGQDPQVADAGDVTRLMLDQLAGTILHRTISRSASAIISHLHEVLFEINGFGGTIDKFEQLESHLLTSTLQQRCGAPTCLGLIYQRVADRVGLTAEGIDTPGYLLIRVQDESGWLIVDPFRGGCSMAEDEAIAGLAKASELSFEQVSERFRPISNLAWFQRILRTILHGTRPQLSGNSARFASWLLDRTELAATVLSR